MGSTANEAENSPPGVPEDAPRQELAVKDLPHGLLQPPECVRELLPQEKARHPPEVFTPEVEEQMLNQWVIAYHFDYLGHEVIYPQTPDGPNVLAVGDMEVIHLKKTLPLEEQLKLESWLPY